MSLAIAGLLAAKSVIASDAKQSRAKEARRNEIASSLRSSQ
jgi:hypothetical protein